MARINATPQPLAAKAGARPWLATPGYPVMVNNH